MAKYYVVYSTGRPARRGIVFNNTFAVVSEDPNPKDYIAGPFDSPSDAFDRMTELSVDMDRSQSVVGTVLICAALIIGGILLYFTIT